MAKANVTLYLNGPWRNTVKPLIFDTSKVTIND